MFYINEMKLGSSHESSGSVYFLLQQHFVPDWATWPVLLILPSFTSFGTSTSWKKKSTISLFFLAFSCKYPPLIRTTGYDAVFYFPKAEACFF